MPSPEGGFRIGAGEIGSIRGAEVRVVEKFKQPRLSRPTTSNTARHEAKHAVVAEANGTSVKRVTIVPGAGYGGLTELSRPDPIAAMASHGESGTGHDRLITRLMGYSEDASARAAQDFINKNSEEVDAVAYSLDKHKTLDGNNVRKIMNQVYEEKNKPPDRKADIFIKNPDGSEHKLLNRALTPEGIVKDPIDLVPGQWTTIPGKKAVAG